MDDRKNPKSPPKKSLFWATSKLIPSIPLILLIAGLTTTAVPLPNDRAEANPMAFYKLMKLLGQELSEAVQKYSAKEINAVKVQSVIIRATVRDINGYRIEDIRELMRGTDPVRPAEDRKERAQKRYPTAVDLRWADNPVQDQGPEGMCTAFAISAVLESRLMIEKLSRVKVSENNVWSHYQQPNLLLALETVAGKNLVTYLFPPLYRGHAVPEDQTQRASFSSAPRIPKHQSLGTLLELLVKKEAFVMAVEITDGFSNFDYNPDRAAIGLITDNGSKPVGGHAVAVVGYILDEERPENGYFIIRNSWGKKWGEDGYGYLPFSWCDNHICGAWRLSGVAVHRKYQ